MFVVPTWLKQLFGIDVSEISSDSTQSEPDEDHSTPRGRLGLPGDTFEALIQAVERHIVHQELESSVIDLRRIVAEAQSHIDVLTVFLDFAASIGFIGPCEHKYSQEREDARQLLDESQERLTTALIKVPIVLRHRDRVLSQVYRDLDGLIDDCENGKIVGFDNNGTLWSFLRRNAMCSTRLKDLEAPGADFRASRDAYIAASRAARGKGSCTRTPSIAEALENEKRCRTEFEVRKTEIERQRAAESSRTEALLIDRVAPLLFETGVLPSRGWSSSGSDSESSNASITTRPVHDQGRPITVQIPQEEAEREVFVAEIERARDSLSSWEVAASRTIPEYQLMYVNFMFTRPKATKQQWEEFYAQEEELSLEAKQQENEERLRTSRLNYEWWRAEAEKNGMDNLPFDSTEFAASGSPIASGGTSASDETPGADDRGMRSIRKWARTVARGRVTKHAQERSFGQPRSRRPKGSVNSSAATICSGGRGVYIDREYEYREALEGEVARQREDFMSIMGQLPSPVRPDPWT